MSSVLSKQSLTSSSSQRYRVRRKLPPWWLYIPALMAGLFVIIPMTVVGIQALKSSDFFESIAALFNHYHRKLLVNTVILIAAVLSTSLLLAWPSAWLTTRPWLKSRQVWSVLLILPLAIPGYVMAYCLRGLGGYGGFLHVLLDMDQPLPRLQGLLGAWLALSLYNYPYLYLNLRSALFDFEASGRYQLEAAQSMGHGRLSRFFRIILPHMRPALWSGGLIITLHVLGDFGVVAMMRYPTMTYELYLHRNLSDITTASQIVFLLTGFASIFILAEMFFIRKITLSSSSKGTARKKSNSATNTTLPHRKTFYANLYLSSIIFSAVILPVIIILFWARKLGMTGLTEEFPSVIKAFKYTLGFGLATACVTALLAIPIASLRPRFPSRVAALLERIPYIGYAMPALAFALSLVFVFMRTPFYETSLLLVMALSFHFLAEAVGPIRSGFFQFPARMEEASRSLGRGRMATFLFVTLPALKQGVAAAVILTLLSVIKELPITLMLCPIGTTTLAQQIWFNTDDAAFDVVAPYALCIILLCGSLTALVLKYVKRV